MITVSCLRLMTEDKQKGVQGETIWDSSSLPSAFMPSFAYWGFTVAQTKLSIKSYKQTKVISCLILLHFWTAASQVEIYCTWWFSCWVPGSPQVAWWGSCVPMENLIEGKTGGWIEKKKETGLTSAENSCGRVGRCSGDAYVPETSPVLAVWLLLHLINRLSEYLLHIPFLDALGECYLSLFLTTTLSMIRF